MAATELTTLDIALGYEDGRWQGWGYLGARENAPEHQADLADQIVLLFANTAGWDADTLFHWMNSRTGRHFGDLAFGGGLDLGAGDEAAEVISKARRWGLFEGTDFIPASEVEA